MMMKTFKSAAILRNTLAILVILNYPADVLAADAHALATAKDDRISYSIGYQIAHDLKSGGVVINKAQILNAIDDLIAHAPARIPEEDMRTTLIEFRSQLIVAQKQHDQALRAERRDQGQTFLSENGKKAGVITTASGLQYRMLQTGQGSTPSAHDEVTVRYRATTIDGKEFDSSARRGEAAHFNLDQVIPGWREGLQQMKAGGKIALYVPPSLGYGERGPLADQTLIFEVELVSVNDQADNKAKPLAE